MLWPERAIMRMRRDEEMSSRLPARRLDMNAWSVSSMAAAFHWVQPCMMSQRARASWRLRSSSRSLWADMLYVCGLRGRGAVPNARGARPQSAGAARSERLGVSFFDGVWWFDHTLGTREERSVDRVGPLVFAARTDQRRSTAIAMIRSVPMVTATTQIHSIMSALAAAISARSRISSNCRSSTALAFVRSSWRALIVFRPAPFAQLGARCSGSSHRAGG
jgi:hypothetical protein